MMKPFLEGMSVSPEGGHRLFEVTSQSSVAQGAASSTHDASQSSMAQGAASSTHETSQSSMAQGAASSTHEASQSSVAQGAASSTHEASQSSVAQGAASSTHDASMTHGAASHETSMTQGGVSSTHDLQAMQHEAVMFKDDSVSESDKIVNCHMCVIYASVWPLFWVGCMQCPLN